MSWIYTEDGGAYWQDDAPQNGSSDGQGRSVTAAPPGSQPLPPGATGVATPDTAAQQAASGAASAGAPKPFSGNLQDLWTQYRQAHPEFHPTQGSATSLQPFVDWAKSQGAQISLAPAGSGGYVKGILDQGGQFIKLLDGSDQPIWQPGSGSGGVNDYSSMNIDPSYLAPFNQPFDLRALALQGGAASPDQSMIPNWDPSKLPPIPQFQAPGAFQAPTAQSILDDPSYQFRRDQAVDSLTKSRAAQGLFNSGGTIYDVGNLASNFAGTEYGNIYNRDLGLWSNNWQNALNKFGADLSGYNAGFNQYATGYGNQLNASNEAYNRAQQIYGNQRDIFYANENNPFNKLNTIAQLGANTAANAG